MKRWQRRIIGATIGVFAGSALALTVNCDINELEKKQEWVKGYKVGVEKRYIPAVGVTETKRKNPELMLKFRG